MNIANRTNRNLSWFAVLIFALLSACNSLTPQPTAAPTPTPVPTAIVLPTAVESTHTNPCNNGAICGQIEEHIEYGGACVFTQHELDPGASQTFNSYRIILTQWKDKITATTVNPMVGPITVTRPLQSDNITGVLVETPNDVCTKNQILQYANQYKILAPDDLKKAGVIGGDLLTSP